MDYLESDDTPVKVLTSAADVTLQVLTLAYECAEAAYGLGNDFRINWDRAYGMLEMYGYSVEVFDSPADRKIRRLVNQLRRKAGLGTNSIES